MKKGHLFVLLCAIFICVTVFAFTACNKTVTNAEYEEFATVMKTVLANSVERMDNSAKSSSDTSVTSFANFGSRPIIAAKTEGAGLFDVLNRHQGTAVVQEENYVKGFFDLVMQTVVSMPLVAGDALRTYPKVDKFYGVSVGSKERGMSVVVNKTGTHYTILVRTEAPVLSDEYFVMELEYTGENDFSFCIYQIASARENMNAYQMFYYGDSDLRFLNLYLTAVNETGDESGGIVYYINGTDYVQENPDALEEVYALVKDGFQSSELDRFKVLQNPNHNITGEQWDACYNKYIGNDGHFDTQGGHLDIRNGVLYGWVGNFNDCPSTIEIPATVNALYYELHFPDRAKELVIPSSVKSVKVEKGVLDRLEGAQEEGTDRTLVECPLEYFIIIGYAEDGSDNFLKEITLKGNSALFEIKDRCLYSKSDGMLLYVPESNSLTKLVLDANISEGARYCLRLANLPALSEVEATLESVPRWDGGTEIFNPLDELFFNYNGNKNYSLNKLSVYGSIDVSTALSVASGVSYIREIVVDVQDIEEYASCSIEIECRADRVKVLDAGTDCQVNISSAVKNLFFDCESEVEVYDIYGESSGSGSTIQITARVQSLDVSLGFPARIELPYPALSWLSFSHKFLPNDIRDILAQYTNDQLAATTELVSHQGMAETVYVFSEPTADEVAIAENFQTIEQIPESMSEYGVNYIRLSGFKGASAVLNIPETVYGLPVLEVMLFGAVADETNLKELHLPSSLKRFSMEGEFALEKIVFEGSKNEFFRLMGEDRFVYQLFDYMQKIVCNDGEIIPAPNPAQEEIHAHIPEQNAFVVVRVDWSANSIEVELTVDGKTYTSHNIGQFSEETYYILNFCRLESTDEFGETREYYKYCVNIARYNTVYAGDKVFYDISASLKIYSDPFSHEFYDFQIISRLEPDQPFVLEHKWTAETDIELPEEQPPTCEKEGYRYYVCELCYEQKTEIIGSALGHDWSEWITVCATCDEAEHQHRYCKRDGCNATQNTDYSGEPLGHLLSEIYGVDSTCSEHAHSEQRCTREGCDYVYKFDYDNNSVLKDHSYELRYQRDPECDYGGLKEYQCSVCGHIHSEPFGEPLGHSYGEDGLCTRCKAVHVYFDLGVNYNSDGEIIYYNILGVNTNAPQTVVIPYDLQGIRIKNIVFYGEANFTSLIFADGWTSLDQDNVFLDNAYNLQSIILPRSLKNLSYEVLLECSGLRNIYFEGSLDEWEAAGFYYYANYSYYFYAEENPYDNGIADDQYFYWYYDTDGQTPIVWTKTEF